MSEQTLNLITKGCIGTCWYGKYHYLEPWAGCEHSCYYCYARFRSPVKNKLNELGTTFDNPMLLFSPDEILSRVSKDISAMNVNIFKLSRFTDIFSPRFVKNGFTYKLLDVLCKSSAQRIIITTKGIPGEDILSLMADYREKISYNVVAKPECGVIFEPFAPSVSERLKTASKVNKLGIKTTVHMDPLIPGLEDTEKNLIDFIKMLNSFNLNRVMFSYLLLTNDIVSSLKEKIPAVILANILESYDAQNSIQYLPGQKETVSFQLKESLLKENIVTINRLLKNMDFKYVLCGLKNCGSNIAVEKMPVCDGSFYA